MQMYLPMDTCGLPIPIPINGWKRMHLLRMAESEVRKKNRKRRENSGMTGAAGAIFPESYNEAGSMWEHLERNGIEFYNFGFGVEFDAGSFSDSTFKYGGVRYLVNYPIPGPLYDRTSRLFPTFNMAIPDQFRTDIFIKEINEKYINQKKDLPPVLTLQLLNDHGAGERAHAGFPLQRKLHVRQ